MKNSVTSRIRVNKSGKIMRRTMGMDHFRTKKTSRQRRDGRKLTGLRAGRFLKKLNSL